MFSVVLTMALATPQQAQACGHHYASCCGPYYCAPVCCVPAPVCCGPVVYTCGCPGYYSGPPMILPPKVTPEEGKKLTPGKDKDKDGKKITPGDKDKDGKKITPGDKDKDGKKITPGDKDKDGKKITPPDKDTNKPKPDNGDKKVTPDKNTSIEAPAIVVVSLPADATLTFEGQATRTRSAERVFQSPPLQAGRAYTYTVTATVVHDGVAQVVKQRVGVEAGKTSRVTFDFAPAALASK